MVTALVAVAVVELIAALINQILFALSVILARILDVLYEVFEVFGGIKPVTYNGAPSYLLDVFLSNSVIGALYKGMALIGIAMTIAFAIAAVIKKSFDSSGEKVKATYGMIIGNVLKAILLILLMTAIVSATIDATGVLMQQISYLFDNAEELADPSEINFDDQDYANMFRVIDTIGNYSLNPSYNNRVNINACYNAIRGDLQLMEKAGMFRFNYDATEEAKNSWQAAMLLLYNAGDVYEELPADQYNEAITDAILSCVEKIQQDASFKPLSYYYRGYTKSTDDFSLGKTLMVSASLEAAKSSKYNENPNLYDDLRRPYMTGQKNIYKYTQVKNDFNIEIGQWHHAVCTLATWMFIKEFIKMIINCVARIFNIILLYISAPPFIAVMPMDDGGKVKQWTTAFIVQSLSIFGSVIAVRLAFIFIPIILSSNLVIFPASSVKNILSKIVMIIGIIATAEKASGMITGILTDNAGYQSIMAGDVGSGLMQRGAALAGKAIGAAMTAGKAIGGVALKGDKALSDATGLTTKVKGLSDSVSGKFQSMRDKGGFRAAKKSGWQTNEGAEKAASSKADSDFKSGVLDKLGSIGATAGKIASNTGDIASNTQSADQKKEQKKQAEKKKGEDKKASMRGSQSKDDANFQGKGAKKLEGHGRKIKDMKDDTNIGSSKLTLGPPPALGKIKPKPPTASKPDPKAAPKAPPRASNEEAAKNGRNRSNAVYKKK